MRYARPQNAHLHSVNCAFPACDQLQPTLRSERRECLYSLPSREEEKCS